MLRVYRRNLVTGEEEIVPDGEFLLWEGRIDAEQWTEIEEGQEVLLSQTHGETQWDQEPIFQVVARDE